MKRFNWFFGEEVFNLDQDLFESFIDSWQTDVVGRDLAIDESHKVEGRALGWVQDMQIEDGDFVLYAKPTPEGESVLGESLKYASIWYRDNYVDQETGIDYGPTLMGCAATNIPFVHRQEPIGVVMSANLRCDRWICENNRNNIPYHPRGRDADCEIHRLDKYDSNRGIEGCL